MLWFSHFGCELYNIIDMLVLFFFILLPGLLPIEMERLRECMKNSARLKELGLADPYAKMLAEYGL